MVPFSPQSRSCYGPRWSRDFFCPSSSTFTTCLLSLNKVPERNSHSSIPTPYSPIPVSTRTNSQHIDSIALATTCEDRQGSPTPTSSRNVQTPKPRASSALFARNMLSLPFLTPRDVRPAPSRQNQRASKANNSNSPTSSGSAPHNPTAPLLPTNPPTTQQPNTSTSIPPAEMPTHPRPTAPSCPRGHPPIPSRHY